MFFENSGINDLAGTSQKAVAISNQVAAECGLGIHDLVLAGSSNGCYAALYSAIDFYVEDYVAAKALITLDMAVDWGAKTLNLEAKERATIAEAGTKLYLFEDHVVGIWTDAVRDLVKSGNDVTMVYCTNENHDMITHLAFKNGMLSWAMGEFTAIDESQYTLRPLTG